MDWQMERLTRGCDLKNGAQEETTVSSVPAEILSAAAVELLNCKIRS